MACTPKRAETLRFSRPPVFAYVKGNCGHFCCVSCFFCFATVSAHMAKSGADKTLGKTSTGPAAAALERQHRSGSSG